MNKISGQKIEKAVRILSEYMPASETLSKPTLFHCIRVGVYLYNHYYPEEVIIAGILHDILEDTNLTEEELTSSFGKTVTDLVEANTKDRSIINQDERIKELINRCVKYGENALIVKAADILDNFEYFQSIEDAKGIDYCLRNARVLMESMPEGFKDKIFESLKNKIISTQL